jgi:RND family efflux transporter MFP subunit
VPEEPDDHRRRWALVAAAVLAAGLAAAAALVLFPDAPGREAAPAAPLARFATVEAPPETVSLRADGEVRAPERIRLVAEVPGRIVRVAEGLESGARLAAGDLVVEIDPATYETAVADARARLASAEAELGRARDQAGRIEALAADDLDSESRLEAARTTRDAAEAAVERARAALREAELRLEDTRLLAPFDATVVEESAAPGRFLAAGESVAELAAVGAAEIEIGLPPAAERTLRTATGAAGARGLGARVRPDGPGPRRAVVDRIQPEIDPRARTLDLVVRVPGAFDEAADGPPLRLGELVTVAVEVPAADDWWRVPATALKGPARLWRLGDDDRLEPVDVTVLVRQADHALVATDALAAGDRVLLTDLVNPAPGQPVRVEGSDGAAP